MFLSLAGIHVNVTYLICSWQSGQTTAPGSRGGAALILTSFFCLENRKFCERSTSCASGAEVLPEVDWNVQNAQKLMLTKFAADRAWFPLLRVFLKMLAAQTDKILFEPRRENWHATPLHQISKLSNVPPHFIFEGLISFVQRPNPWTENYFELRILKSFTGHGKRLKNAG